MRSVIASLGLGFLGAALSGGTAGAALPFLAGVSGGLAGGVASNLATDIFKRIDEQFCARFLDGWSGIDENHHIVAALRSSQINALRSLIVKFEDAIGKQDSRAEDIQDAAFSKSARAFLDREMKAATKRYFRLDEGEAIRKSILELLPDTFDKALAMRRAGSTGADLSTPQRASRIFAERSVLLELQQGCGLASIPSRFEQMLLGEQGGDAWFDLFVKDAAHRLTQQTEFSAIWQAEQISLLHAILAANGKSLEEISLILNDIRFKQDSVLNAVISMQNDLGHSKLDLSHVKDSVAYLTRILDKSSEESSLIRNRYTQEVDSYIDGYLDTMLEIYVARRDINMVLAVIERGANVNLEIDVYGSCGIWLAAEAEEGNIAETVELIRHLYIRGLNPNARDIHGQNILFDSSFMDYRSAITELSIAHGADVNGANKQGETPLMQAAIFADTINARILIENGSDLDAIDISGKNALYHAIAADLVCWDDIERIESDALAFTKLLIEHGASYYASINQLVTIAKNNNFNQVIEFLENLSRH